MIADPTPDIAALIEQMSEKAERIGETWSTMSRYGRLYTEVGTGHQVVCLVFTHREVHELGKRPSIEESGLGVARLDHIAASCPANVRALVAAFGALTARAEAERSDNVEYRRRLEEALSECEAAERERTAAEARVAELEETLQWTRGAAGGDFHRAARLLSPAKDAPGETTGAR